MVAGKAAIEEEPTTERDLLGRDRVGLGDRHVQVEPKEDDERPVSVRARPLLVKTL